MLMNEYKIGYIVIFFVFSLDVANIISEIYYGVVTGERYGMQILTTADGSCWLLLLLFIVYCDA